uniref:Uncharacterized protein n=1 Tax=viral metagenome TaxID=1070528 RepID=A0A6M3L5I3_9ZZZZ
MIVVVDDKVCECKINAKKKTLVINKLSYTKNSFKLLLEEGEEVLTVLSCSGRERRNLFAMGFIVDYILGKKKTLKGKRVLLGYLLKVVNPFIEVSPYENFSNS